MKISIITLFPAMLSGFFNESIVKRAQDKKRVDIELINLREFAVDAYGSVDDRPYGGGVGMVMRVEPIYDALRKLKVKSPKSKVKGKVILTSPKGKSYTHKKAREYAQLDHLIMIAGHYEGVDERVMSFVDEEVSMGDFILTGGEIIASAITDSVVRLLPGVLKKDDATYYESFREVSIDDLIEVVGNDPLLTALRAKGRVQVQLLECPHYTRPEIFQTMKVPEVLLSGHHKAIHMWQLKMAYQETLKKRKDLLE